MYQNCCKKCGSIALHTEVKGNNTGLYCDDCGAWIKWLGKDELRAFEHAIIEGMKSRKEKIDENNKVLSDFLNGKVKTTEKRLVEFAERLDKEIDDEYEKYPSGVADSIRKSAYCHALQKVKCSIENIIAGRDFDDMGE